MPIFAERVLDELAESLVSLQGRYLALAQAYVLFPYKTERGKEYGAHGYVRRFKMMNHCVQRVFQLLPPDQDNSPEEDVLLDATVCVQSFVMNVFGALDNLAWIWVSEKPLNLKKWDVGLGPKCEMVRASFSRELQVYLSGRESWFQHIVDFRDALAHRIPLFIPPHRIPPENDAAYTALEHRMLAAHDMDEYERLKAEQLKLVVFQPVMKHTLYDNNPPVVFHFQLLQDFGTVEEIGEKMLVELKRG
jgi:hypothetical protein